jgi:AraC family transcriptional regulator
LSKAPSPEYLARFRKVLDHIDAHLDAELGVEGLSLVAAFSKYHFHRQFSELFGVPVHQYVQQLRIKRAGYELAFRQRRVLDIALASGYESHEAFTRAFKQHVGQAPSEFRQRPAWTAWHETQRPARELRSVHMKPEYRAEDVKIVTCDDTRVATLEHRGDPNLLGDSIRKFIAWRRENRLPPKVSATFNILYDDPEQTPPERFRLDICAAAPRGVAPNAVGVIEKVIPGGRCAVLRHTGSDDTLGAAISFLYSTWLPASGEELRDFPLYLQRVSFFPDVPEHEAVSDLFLPLRR